MALGGIDTGALETYSDDLARDQRLKAARERIVLEPLESIDRMAAKVSIDLKDGRTIVAEHNVGIPATDIDGQWERLTTKFRSLCIPLIGEAHTTSLIEQIANLDEAETIDALMPACLPST